MRVHYIPGNRSGSVRFLLMKTSQTLQMILHCYNLVKRTFQMIHFIFNSQKTGWIFQSLALFVFLTTGQALLTRKVTFMVSLKYKLPLCVYLCASVCISGWGDTGVQDTSTEKLQETVVRIVQSSNCTEKMNQTGSVDENQIVCAEVSAGGPCKVGHQQVCTCSALCLT